MRKKNTHHLRPSPPDVQNLTTIQFKKIENLTSLLYLLCSSRLRYVGGCAGPPLALRNYLLIRRINTNISKYLPFCLRNLSFSIKYKSNNSLCESMYVFNYDNQSITLIFSKILMPLRQKLLTFFITHKNQD